MVEHTQRVRARSALRARAPNPALLGASHARWALPGCLVAEPAVVCVAPNTDPVAGKAPGGAQAGRIGAAEERRLWVGARTRALRDLTCRILFERSAAKQAKRVMRHDPKPRWYGRLPPRLRCCGCGTPHRTQYSQQGRKPGWGLACYGIECQSGVVQQPLVTEAPR